MAHLNSLPIFIAKTVPSLQAVFFTFCRRFSVHYSKKAWPFFYIHYMLLNLPPAPQPPSIRF